MTVDLTPPEDTPTVSVTQIGTFSGVPTITGSVGWWREKREGVAEPAPGAGQLDDTNLDVAGSTYFRYPGTPAALPNAAAAWEFVISDFKPGGSSQSAKWLFNVSFATESPEVEFRCRAQRANPYLGLIFVNGRRVSELAVPTGFASAGSSFAAKLTFPDSRPRTITVYGLNHTEGSFGGVGVGPGHTITKAAAPTKTVAIIGDSYANGHSGVAAVETYAFRLALLMGADCIIQAGIGGTGWDTIIGGDPTSNFAGRIADVMAMSPDVVIFGGGRNDTAAVGPAVEAALDAVGTGVERWVLPTASESGQATVRSAIAAACASRGVAYLDCAVDSLPKIADNVHPTYTGHVALADDAYARMAPASTPAAYLGTAPVTLMLGSTPITLA